jgi:hypothetical protein
VRQAGYLQRRSVYVIMLLASSVSVNTEFVRGHRPEFKRTEVSVSEETREFPWPFLQLEGGRPVT